MSGSAISSMKLATSEAGLIGRRMEISARVPWETRLELLSLQKIPEAEETKASMTATGTRHILKIYY